MKFATISIDGKKTFAALVKDEAAIPLHALVEREEPFTDLREFLESGGAKLLENISPGARRDLETPLSKVTFHAPILRPPKIIALGRSYQEHAAEQGRSVTEQPTLFAKARNTVIGHGDDIVIPRGIEQVDYEVELCLVISSATTGPVKPENAIDAVLGFTIMNDVSARDAQFSDKQWYRGKSFRTFAPTGPVVVTPDELNWEDLSLRTFVNNEERQASRTSQLAYPIPEIISFISEVHDFEPGDLVATGTPSGVGVFMDPQVFLVPGDEVVLEIEGIGKLINKVVEA